MKLQVMAEVHNKFFCITTYQATQGWNLKGKKYLFLLAKTIEIRETEKQSDPVIYTVYVSL